MSSPLGPWGHRSNQWKSRHILLTNDSWLEILLRSKIVLNQSQSYPFFACLIIFFVFDHKCLNSWNSQRKNGSRRRKQGYFSLLNCFVVNQHVGRLRNYGPIRGCLTIGVYLFKKKKHSKNQSFSPFQTSVRKFWQTLQRKSLSATTRRSHKLRI